MKEFAKLANGESVKGLVKKVLCTGRKAAWKKGNCIIEKCDLIAQNTAKHSKAP